MATDTCIEVNVFQCTLTAMYVSIAIAQFLLHILSHLHTLKIYSDICSIASTLPELFVIFYFTQDVFTRFQL